MTESPNSTTLEIVPAGPSIHERIQEILFDQLFAYSEWLDGDQHLIVGDNVSEDKRSHDQLVRDFLAAQG
ncbi:MULTISPECIES: hypothetical protein [Mycobacteroides]|uniref:hypothetical protein n=1 Tax=Mycobacteroides TaxID=670516 RepID=UPI0009280882|nr:MULTISPECIES: hypothetical protein [Mycobacteroides]SIE27960.1 Uncharacterised protein [Mycobacteroides abscessus subsp. abscessus]SIJ65392.1 Uncharacterised protein [Mycobacteroides abscessus subsp. abscessus]